MRSQCSTFSVGAPRAEHDAADAVAPAGAGLLGDHLAVLAAVDALDLPDVGLDARVLELGDARGASARGGRSVS